MTKSRRQTTFKTAATSAAATSRPKIPADTLQKIQPEKIGLLCASLLPDIKAFAARYQGRVARLDSGELAEAITAYKHLCARAFPAYQAAQLCFRINPLSAEAALAAAEKIEETFRPADFFEHEISELRETTLTARLMQSPQLAQHADWILDSRDRTTTNGFDAKEASYWLASDRARRVWLRLYLRTLSELPDEIPAGKTVPVQVTNMVQILNTRLRDRHQENDHRDIVDDTGEWLSLLRIDVPAQEKALAALVNNAGSLFHRAYAQAPSRTPLSFAAATDAACQVLQKIFAAEEFAAMREQITGALENDKLCNSMLPRQVCPTRFAGYTFMNFSGTAADIGATAFAAGMALTGPDAANIPDALEAVKIAAGTFAEVLAMLSVAEKQKKYTDRAETLEILSARLLERAARSAAAFKFEQKIIDESYETEDLPGYPQSLKVKELTAAAFDSFWASAQGEVMGSAAEMYGIARKDDWMRETDIFMNPYRNAAVLQGTLTGVALAAAYLSAERKKDFLQRVTAVFARRDSATAADLSGIAGVDPDSRGDFFVEKLRLWQREAQVLRREIPRPPDGTPRP